MRKKFMLFIVSLAVLCSGSDSLWGQTFLQPHSATSPQKNVNNAFGAGESSKITAGAHTAQFVVNPPLVFSPYPTRTDEATFPYAAFNNQLEDSPVSDIQLGGTEENVVIRAYTGNGFAMGWISIIDHPIPTTNATHRMFPGGPETATTATYNGVAQSGLSGITYPTGSISTWTTAQKETIYDLIQHLIVNRYEVATAFGYEDASSINTTTHQLVEFSFNKFNTASFTVAAWGTLAPCNNPLFRTDNTTSGTTTNIRVWTHIDENWKLSYNVEPTPNPLDIYTSTIDDVYQKIYPIQYYDDIAATTFHLPMDDEIPLVQFNGLEMKSGLAMATQSALISSLDPNNVKGDINPNNPGALNQSAVYLNNYKRPTTIYIDEGGHFFSNFIVNDIKWMYESNTVILDRSVLLGNLTTCDSGQSSAFGFDVGWDSGLEHGQTLVDGAIALIPNALVCVLGNVADNTSSSGSISSYNTTSYAAGDPDDKTDAILILPIETDGRFTLRVGGDYDKLNMMHDETSSEYYYKQDDFPDAYDHIFLYTDQTSPHPFGNYPLISYNGSLSTGTITSISAPPVNAEASIFGVNLDYIWTTNNANIHTTATGNFMGTFDKTQFGGDDNRGVIEIGSLTDGKKYFYIYSGGILKNIECVVPSNFPMNFGTTYGGMPNLYLDANEDLSILNYGNNGQNFCDAKIIFDAGSMATIKDAFDDATGSGAFRLQALSNVELLEDAEFDASTSGMGNNIYVLSDGGNIITQKVDIVSDWINGIGSGLIAFWAEDRSLTGTPGFNCPNTPGNRNSSRGNIYLNDDATITRTVDSADNTETNFVAANNIRTANFEYISNSEKSDFTSIISRKGDIYLGYSKDADDEFTYQITDPANAGELNIKAGYDDIGTSGSSAPLGGGNIYFTHINASMIQDGTYPTNIMIPLSLQYVCTTTNLLHQRNDEAGSSMQDYEHAGIIGGLGRCGIDGSWDDFAGVLANPGTLSTASTKTLIYNANGGHLLLDAGSQGNIIINRGTFLDFQSNDGNAFFRTRNGDIDLRDKTDIEYLNPFKGVVFLADNGIADKSKIACFCDEESNNVYIQDFNFVDFPGNNAGSVFFGADNNIKLQYGGLKNQGTWRDPFLSDDTPYPCGTNFFHCNSDTLVNHAGPMILDYTGSTSGGVGIVASDLIDIYTKMVYTGGSTNRGMDPVPQAPTNPAPNAPATDGKLHGENVAGYGLYIKSQANKSNWGINSFDPIDGCPPPCPLDECGRAFLHQVARVTFHHDALIRPENSKAYIGGPTVEVYGVLEMNTNQGAGAKPNQLLHIQADSLIVHDDFILDGTKWRFSTWSHLERDMPVIKLGHQRFTPPFTEDGLICAPCIDHKRNGVLDTITVAFMHGAHLDRLHCLVVDHTVLTFETDSFDHFHGGDVINAEIFTDTLKIRNQVELWTNPDKTLDGHLELVSEIQMGTKDYAGIYTRHLHMEPIAPTCKPGYDYSELWFNKPTLDVITSSTFGGFGTLHADVYMETQARLAPGYASLGVKGNCYEQRAGTLTMQELHMDWEAELHYSIGNESGSHGELADCIEVDNLHLHDQVNVFVEKRCGQYYTPGCYEIIRYKRLEDDYTLNHLHLQTKSIDGTPLSLDTSTPGVVYLCVGENARPKVQREIILPQPPAGVTINPAPGYHYGWFAENFIFTLIFDGPIYEVTTNRTFDGQPEVLTGVLNENGEYVYTIYDVRTQPIYVYIGPATVANEMIGKASVWSSGNTLYIRVATEDIASIYSITGMLVNRIDVPEGGTTQPLAKGAYIVTLKDGSVHKVIVR